MTPRDIPRKLANELVRAALGPRAYASKRPGATGAAMWLDNSDGALCGDHQGPILAAKGEDYRELVRLAESRSLFKGADDALRGRPLPAGRPTWRGLAPSGGSFVVRAVSLPGGEEAFEVLLPSGGGWDRASVWLSGEAATAREADPAGLPPDGG